MDCIAIVIVLTICLAATYLALLIRWIYKRCKRQSENKENDVSGENSESLLDMVDGDLDVESGRSSKRRPTLDLHGKSRQQALMEVDQFIQSHQNCYQNTKNKSNRHVNIITGRGLHSVNNFPVLKMETKKYLDGKGLNYSMTSKGGQLVIDLKS